MRSMIQWQPYVGSRSVRQQERKDDGRTTGTRQVQAPPMINGQNYAKTISSSIRDESRENISSSSQINSSPWGTVYNITRLASLISSTVRPIYHRAKSSIPLRCSRRIRKVSHSGAVTDAIPTDILKQMKRAMKANEGLQQPTTATTTIPDRPQAVEG